MAAGELQALDFREESWWATNHAGSGPPPFVSSSRLEPDCGRSSVSRAPACWGVGLSILERMSNLIIVTGASGSGKTACVEHLALRRPDWRLLHFDSIGVPSHSEMEAGWGSPAAWQRDATLRWVARIASDFPLGLPTVLEGQTRIEFLSEALSRHQLAAQIVLLDCDDQTRVDRLSRLRGQPELATKEMSSWAQFLRMEARACSVRVLDTSLLSIHEVADTIIELALERPV